LIIFYKKSKKSDNNINNEDEKVILLTKKENIHQYQKQMQKGDKFCSIGGVVIVQLNKSINQGFKIICKAGSGKTQIISGMLNDSYKENNLYKNINYNAVILDIKNDYTGVFYKPDKDIIFNPTDERCPAWNIFDEIANKADISLVANTLIGEVTGADVNKYWIDNARIVLEAMISYLKITKQGTNENLVALARLSAEELVKEFTINKTIEAECSLAIPPLTAGEKVAPVLMSELARHLKPFRILPSVPDHKGMKTFNIEKDFLSQKGVRIFLNSTPNTEDMVRPLLTLFVELLSRKFLSKKDFENNTTLFVLDEFTSLNKMSGLTNMLDKGRSKNAITIIGTQDMGKINEIYGQNISETILNNCSNSVYLSVEHNKTAEFISNQIGKQEVERYTQSHNIGGTNSDQYTNTQSMQRVEKSVFLPSTIMGFKNLECTVKLAETGYFHFKFSYHKYEDLQKPFIASKRLEIVYEDVDIKVSELTNSHLEQENKSKENQENKSENENKNNDAIDDKKDMRSKDF
jgi:type IV secretory pathway TraG/TraD family ATPase VirD4